MSARARSLALALALVLLSARTAAQAPAPRAEPSEAELQSSRLLLGPRDRYRMHAGEALLVSGRAEEGGELRARTPALQRGGSDGSTLDSEALYRRTLAIYEKDASYHAPVHRSPSAAAAPRGEAEAPRPAQRAQPARAPAAPGRPLLGACLAGALAAGLVALWLARRLR